VCVCVCLTRVIHLNLTKMTPNIDTQYPIISGVGLDRSIRFHFLIRTGGCRNSPVALGGPRGLSPPSKVLTPLLSFVLLLFRIWKKYGVPAASKLPPPPTKWTQPTGLCRSSAANGPQGGGGGWSIWVLIQLLILNICDKKDNIWR